MTSHAAVVSRGWGKPAVVGCGDITIDYDKQQFTSQPTGKVVKRGDWLSLDGTGGYVAAGQMDTVPPQVTPELQRFLALAKSFATIQVRANADTPPEVAQAMQLGADGVGLTRTEHQFWAAERIKLMRAMLLAQDNVTRDRALAGLFPYLRGDFLEIFKQAAKANGGTSHRPVPVTIRLLDPPRHEYLPKPDQTELIREVAGELGMSVEHVVGVIKGMIDLNPMLGHRGCRVEITHPTIPTMQVRAIISAAVEAVVKQGLNIHLEIMVPLIATRAELEFVRRIIDKAAGEAIAEAGGSSVSGGAGAPQLQYRVGCMLETPRAALVSADIAHVAEFFSFGSNDLTALTFGFSRDDAPKFIPAYLDKGVLKDDPFQSLDIEGVGELVKISIERGRSTRPDLEVGVCGEVGGEERSVAFFVAAGVDYVSCSPWRVPTAILAAAQAALKRKQAGQPAQGGAGGRVEDI